MTYMSSETSRQQSCGWKDNGYKVVGVVLALLSQPLPYASGLGLLLLALFTLTQSTKLSFSLLVLMLLNCFLLKLYFEPLTPWLLLMANLAFTWTAAYVLRTYNKWTHVFTVTLIWLIVSLYVLYQLYPNIQETWQTYLNVMLNITNQWLSQANYTANKVDITLVASGWGKFENQIREHTKVLLQVMTAILLLSSAAGNYLWIAIARAIQQKRQKKSIFQEWREIRLSLVVTLVFTLMLTCPNSWLSFRMELLFITLVMFFIAGLSFLHWSTKLLPTSWLWMLVVYILLSCFPVLASKIIIVLATLDSIIDGRKYLSRFIKSEATI